MAKILKIACLILAVASIWFSISFKGGRTFFKIGEWERPILTSEASTTTDDGGGAPDSTETEFG